MRRALAFAVLALLLLAGPALAEPAQVKVGSYVLNIGEYEIETGSYKADFYLWFEWDDAGVEPNFEFMNGRAETKELVYSEPGYRFYRIEARLYENGDLRNYPSDTQRITIKLEDKLLASSKLAYVADGEGSGISPELEMPGWEIIGNKATVKEVPYADWGESYSRYTHAISIARSSSSLYEIVIPIVFIAIVAWFCFFLPLKELGNRLFIAGSSLIAAVAFHIYITDSIPATGYLTLADKMILSSYAMIVFMLFSFVLIEGMGEKRGRYGVRRVNMGLALVSLAIPVVVFGLLQLLL